MTNTNKANKSKGGKLKMENDIKTASNAPKASSKKKTTTANANPKMKLPLVRKIHIKPAYLALGVVVTILAVFFLRVAIWEHNYLSAMEGSERDVVKVSSNDEEDEDGESEEIDETERVEQDYVDWCTVVAPDKPCNISIPYLGVYANVIEIGLMPQGEMGTPRNIYDVGWYIGAGSVLPGADGVTVMNAHGGDLGMGIFRTLPKLPVGQEINIKMGNGNVYTYRVMESTRRNLGTESDEYMATAFTPLNGTRNTLTLITCTGDWWESQQTYSQRLFVRAALQ